MKEQNRARPGLPPGARAEILEALCADMEISSDEIVAILKRHHVAEDADVLQDRYRRQMGQRLMASLLDDNGRREVMSNGKGLYFVLECCRDQRQLAAGISGSSRASSAASRTRCAAWTLQRARCGYASVCWST